MSHYSQQSAEPPTPAALPAESPPLLLPPPPESDFANATLPSSVQWYNCEEMQCDGFHGCQFTNRDKLPIDTLDVLGSGKWGLVKRVEIIGTKEILAMKEVNVRSHRGLREDILREIRIHRRLQQRHITTVRGCFVRAKSFFNILINPAAEYDLSHYLGLVSEAQELGEPVDEQVELLMDSIGCLSGGLAYLHGQQIRHKDIKAVNILVYNGSVLLTVFGLSTDFSNSGISTTDGPTGSTREYAAPEVLQDEAPRTRKADVFSLGCVFLEIFTILAGRSLEDFMEHRRSDVDPAFNAGIPNRLAWARGLSPLLRAEQQDFLWITALMLALDPESRPSALEIWRHASIMTRSDRSGARTFCGVCCQQSYEPPASDEGREMRAEPQATSLEIGDEEEIFIRRAEIRNELPLLFLERETPYLLRRPAMDLYQTLILEETVNPFLLSFYSVQLLDTAHRRSNINITCQHRLRVWMRAPFNSTEALSRRKIALTCLASSSILQLYRAPWLTKTWNHNDITFFVDISNSLF